MWEIHRSAIPLIACHCLPSLGPERGQPRAVALARLLPRPPPLNRRSSALTAAATSSSRASVFSVSSSETTPSSSSAWNQWASEEPSGHPASFHIYHATQLARAWPWDPLRLNADAERPIVGAVPLLAGRAPIPCLKPASAAPFIRADVGTFPEHARPHVPTATRPRARKPSSASIGTPAKLVHTGGRSCRC